MGIKDKRKNITIGKYSKAVTIPAKLEIGKHSTLAANRLLLVDPRGEIPADKLLEFLEKYVEGIIWDWLSAQGEEIPA